MKISNKFTKSVLRYPGGKSRAVTTILELIPEGTKELLSPFFGGGSVEIAAASLGIKVKAYDIFSPLVNFWQAAIKDSSKIADEVLKYHPLSRDEFYKLQKIQMQETDPFISGTMFFVLNRSSFSGSTLSGGMSPKHPRFNLESISRLRDFKIKNLSVNKRSFEEVLFPEDKTLAYLDPPYLIKNKLYGDRGSTHKNFNHELLAEILKGRDNWILSYNNSPEVRSLYKGYKFLYPSWKYGMGNDKNSKEIIILSHDLAKKLKIS